MRVNIHIEPLGTHIATADRSAGEMRELARDVEDFVNGLRSEFHELTDCHDVRVQQVEHKILLSCHCIMDGNLPITESTTLPRSRGSRQGTLSADRARHDSSRAARAPRRGLAQFGGSQASAPSASSAGKHSRT